MKLVTKQVRSGSIGEKLPAILEQMREDPYLVVGCRAVLGGNAEVFLISPALYKTLLDGYESYVKLTESPEYGELRRRVAQLQQQINALLTELRRVKGLDGDVSDECWREVSGSVLEAVV